MLFGAVVLSIFGAGMWAVVMVYTVIDAGGGPVDLSLVAAANAVGLLVCAIPGGIAADRIPRRLLLRVVELLNLVAITSVAVAGVLGAVTIPHLAVVAFVLGAGAGFFFPAYSAILPRILPPAQLLAANGLEGAIRPALQQAAGPAAAGMIVAAVLAPAHAAWGVVAAHALALVLLLFVRPEPPGRGGRGARAGSGRAGRAATTCARPSCSPSARRGCSGPCCSRPAGCSCSSDRRRCCCRSSPASASARTRACSGSSSRSTASAAWSARSWCRR